MTKPYRSETDMDTDDKKWVEEAIDQTSRAAAKNVTLLLIYRNGDTEVVATNAASPEMVTALWPTEAVQE